MHSLQLCTLLNKNRQPVAGCSAQTHLQPSILTGLSDGYRGWGHHRALPAGLTALPRCLIWTHQPCPAIAAGQKADLHCLADPGPLPALGLLPGPVGWTAGLVVLLHSTSSVREACNSKALLH